MQVASLKESSEAQRVFSQESGSKIENTEIVHRIIGRTFLKESFNPITAYNLTVAPLCVSDISDADKCFEYIASIEKKPKFISEFAKKFRGAVVNARTLVDQLDDIAKFFSRENLEGLKKYGHHPAGDVPFALSFNEASTTIQITGVRRACRIEIGTSLIIPKIVLPTWDFDDSVRLTESNARAAALVPMVDSEPV